VAYRSREKRNRLEKRGDCRSALARFEIDPLSFKHEFPFVGLVDLYTVFNAVRVSLQLAGVGDKDAAALVEAFKGR
jgi:hypothetical protein